MMAGRRKPERSEAPEYYFAYIDLVPDGDVCTTLDTQLSDTAALLERVPAERVDYRYAPGKWSIREVVSHVNDAERLFAFRAFWVARGFTSPLPSFDQETAARHAGAADRSWSSHREEFQSLRASTLHLFRHLPAEGWLRRGIASDHSFTVRAFAYLAAGHVTHHAMILRDRYLSSV